MRVRVFLILVLSLSCLNCGVKGDPLPPVEPVNLGDGQPKFQKNKKKSTYNAELRREEEEWIDEESTENDKK